MNRLVLSLAIVLAFGLVVLAATPAASASTAMPSWSAGDYWTYALNAGTLFGGTFAGSATMRYDVVGPDSLSVGGSSVPVWKTKLNVSVSISSGFISAQLYLNGNAYFRQSDLGQVQQGFSASYGGTTVSFTTSYNPPQAIQWPLTAGAQWTTTTNVTFASSTGSPTTVQETIQSSVQADQSLTVPAGTFTVTPVKQTMGALAAEYTVYFWSATVGNYVSMRNYYSSNDTEISSVDLQSYSFGAGGLGLSSIVLGLPLYAWIAIIVIVVVVIAAVALLRRKKPAPPMMPPPGAMPPGPGPGQPPMPPPQAPPPQP